MTPFEKWVLETHSKATMTTAERIKFGEEYLKHLKAKRADTSKIVKK